MLKIPSYHSIAKAKFRFQMKALLVANQPRAAIDGRSVRAPRVHVALGAIT